VQAIGRAGRMCRGFSRELWWEDSLLGRWDEGKPVNSAIPH
jgi:hypothetical protein